MKLLRNIFIVILFFSILNLGCNEDEYLKEIPLDFKSLENAYITESDFDIAVNALYNGLRLELSAHEHRPVDYLYGTDVGFSGVPNGREFFGDYDVFLIPERDEVLVHWRQFYKVIANSNTILNQLTNADFSDELKRSFEAKCKIFRGVSYLYLGYLFGGVPLVVDAVNEPKTDFQRATREEIYLQAASDLEFAANNLKGITEVRDGEVSNLAAYHLLSEAYLALERYDEAISATTIVIDNPNTSLMMDRFGSRMTEPGDVYWDLFRRNNQNRSSGNTEGIWVFQYELDVEGGELFSTRRAGCQLERVHVPNPYTFSYRDPSGVNPFLSLAISDWGRGVGRLSPTNHFKYTIWKSDWDNDIRNSEYNFIRNIRFSNPNSEWYGQTIRDHYDLFKQTTLDTVRRFYPFQSKATTPNNHPEGVIANMELGTLSASAAGSTYTDQYFIRLAETYLLRAEAYFKKGDLNNAAADINVVRNRANANPVSPGEVNIDYILDERMRELGIEEKRRATLNRLGLLYDRTNRYCDGHADVAPFGINVKPHHNLFPIPQSEIESNITYPLQQNPGY